MTKVRAKLLPMLWLLVTNPVCFATVGQQLPVLGGDTLTDLPVELPAAGKGKVTLVVVGFSNASKTATGAWARRFRKDFGQNPKSAIYQAAILEAVPRLVRGMVIGSIRKGIPKDQAAQFLIVLHDSEAWKKALGLSQPDDAYMVLLDPQGVIRWQHHSVFEERNYTALAEATRQLMP